MPKYLILYSASTPATELMANSTTEQMKASMEEWIKWQDHASQSAKLEWGLPLQAVGQLTKAGQGPSSSKVSGYATIEGDKEVVLGLLKDHPHLKRDDASIDVLEMLSMPGLDQG